MRRDETRRDEMKDVCVCLCQDYGDWARLATGGTDAGHGGEGLYVSVCVYRCMYV